MADNENVAPADAPKSVSVFDEVNAAAKTLVDTDHAGLKDKLARKLADEELSKRTELLYNGIRKFGELKKELNKANKPDHVRHVQGADGKFVEEKSFTVDGRKKFEAAQKALKDLDEALGLAANKANYDKLRKLASGKPADSTEDAAE